MDLTFSRRRRTFAVVTVGATLCATAAITGAGGVATASSHREAPLTAADPQHDNTDLYAFTSPDKTDTVTIIANWTPFEEPNGGPNFYPWAPGSHYNINIDNNGDGKADIVYRYVFKDVDVRGTDKGTFLYNNGPVTSLDDPNLLFKQTYDVEEIRGSKVTKVITGATSAPSFTGKASMPDYGKLRDQAVTTTANGVSTVATQAADPFFLDLRVFDLLYGTDASETGQNTLAGYNVNSIALQVPKNLLALRGRAARNPVIGIWSTTEKQTMTLSAGKATPTGKFVQVSRLGNPLVNEVVIPAQLKDAFNSLTPDQDHTIPAAVDKVLHPELADDVAAIYGIPAPTGDRTDLLEIFLTGICKSCGPIQADLNSQKLNRDGFRGNGFTPAEELRLNMSVPVTAQPNRLGVLGGDVQGFPNGRRLTDDVLDIAVRAVEGAAHGDMNAFATGFSDGVDTPANALGATFPYLALPNTESVNLNTTGQAGK